VYFDNLSRAQLSSLIAAAQPSLALDTQHTLAIHIGGAKPLGLGTAVPSVPKDNLVVYSAASRYGGEAQVSFDVEDEVSSFVRSSTTDPRSRVIWDELTRALATDSVPTDRVWYPTIGRFSDLDGNNEQRKKFNDHFRWFTDHSGARKGRLRHLPDISNPNQYLGPGDA
jgi:hypothetical protein